jgi:site-specific recombinase XerD
METNLSILFYSKTARTNKSGLVPIYLRVTIDGKRFEQSTQRYVLPSKWSAAAGKAKGNNEETKTLNYFLDALKQKVYQYQWEIIHEGLELTADAFRKKWLGVKERPYYLLEIFKQHNEQLRQLIGSDCSKATFGKYRTTCDHTAKFIKWKYQQNDIEIRNLRYTFISDFEFYLKSQQRCNHNTTIKYLSNLRKIINVCIKNNRLAKDPFFGYKMSKKEVVRDFLTEDELQTITSKDFKNERLNQVRDIFLFSCFTGLAYIDAKRLKRSDVCIGIDNEKWIFTRRKKTDSPTRIPLLPTVLEIMEHYKAHPRCEFEGSLLPVPSNAKLNAYLKEIADICGINKHLTFHIARHTFATTITLNNGVPIETVSKMLGHKSLKITQIYAKILDRKISNDMQILRSKFKKTNEEQLLQAL